MRLKRQKPGDLPQMRENWQLCMYAISNFRFILLAVSRSRVLGAFAIGAYSSKFLYRLFLRSIIECLCISVAAWSLTADTRRFAVPTTNAEL